MASNVVKFLLIATATLCTAPAASFAKDANAPDWPCVQRKVADLSPSQVWDGPVLEGLPSWRDDAQVSQLVPILAARRVAMPEAEAKVKAFAESVPPDERDAKLTLLFAGLFETMAAERKVIVGGIERFNRRQKELAQVLEGKSTKIADLEKQVQSDAKNETFAKQLKEAQDTFDWDARIFKERQDNVPRACEIPVIIDERLFALARSIRGLMKS